jgi:thymidylate synthase ThyX
LFKAEVIADSINDAEVRITTFQLRYPRFIHAELMTHRVFSRNARSSRAVPTEKLMEEINRHPAMPIHWGKNQAGMQAKQELLPSAKRMTKTAWQGSASRAIEQAQIMLDLGAHKQIVNRVLEPFTWIDVVVTATEWQNWYGLRAHPDAQPEIQHLAELMLKAHAESIPEYLPEGKWHLPYVTLDDWTPIQKWSEENDTSYFGGWHERDRLMRGLACKISTARCARVSYKAFDGSASPIEKDLELYQKLVGAQPMHASPAEHQAMSDPKRKEDHRWKNFKHWAQHRAWLEGEYRAPFDMSAVTYRVIEGKVYKCVSK